MTINRVNGEEVTTNEATEGAHLQAGDTGKPARHLDCRGGTTNVLPLRMIMWKTSGLAAQTATIAGVALAADQLTKVLVRQSLPLCSASSLSTCQRIDVADNLGLVRVENAGSAFGFHQGLWIWLVVAVLGLLAIPIYARHTKTGWAAAWAVGLQLGGSLGNLSDRFIYGGATDFIDVGWGPIFNLADMEILAGAVMATLLLSQSLFATGPGNLPLGKQESPLRPSRPV